MNYNKALKSSTWFLMFFSCALSLRRMYRDNTVIILAKYSTCKTPADVIYKCSIAL